MLHLLTFCYRFCNKKSLANAKGNARQRCVFEGPLRTKSIAFHLHSPEGVTGLVQPCWLKIANIPYPLSFSALARGDSFLNLHKSFTDPETRVFQAADGEDLVILVCAVLD